MTPARIPDSKSRLHAGGDGRRAAVGLEPLEVEPELLGAPPQMGVVDVPAIGVERGDHLEEIALGAGRLGRRVQGGRAGSLGGEREMAKDEARGRAAISGQEAAHWGQPRSA